MTLVIVKGNPQLFSSIVDLTWDLSPSSHKWPTSKLPLTMSWSEPDSMPLAHIYLFPCVGLENSNYFHRSPLLLNDINLEHQ